MKNADIREEIRQSGLCFWQVAEQYGCADTTFSKKLRHELPNEEKAKIRMAIAELTSDKEVRRA